MADTIRWFWVSPELVLTVAGIVSLLLAAAGRELSWGSSGNKKGLGGPDGSTATALGLSEWVAILGVGAAAVLALLVGLAVRASAGENTHFWGQLTHDPFSAYFKVMVAFGALLVMALLAGYRRAVYNRAEVYGLLTLATLAIFLMASAGELVMIFLAIEFLSLISYILVGYLKDEPRSAEAGVKYFLFGALCSAVMLYGMSLIYGLTGTTRLTEMATSLATGLTVARRQAVVLSLLLLMAGLGFKVSMVPFQQWVPDVYEGAPTPITAFLAVASKAAGFAVAVRILITAFGTPVLAAHWAGIVGVLAILTMTWGNTAAIWQTNMKRMLAYSSIAHAGYILVGVVAAGYAGDGANSYAVPGVLLYLLAYLFMNLGAFAVVIAVANQTGTEEIPGYAGLGRRAPWLAAGLTFLLLSLIGVPPTAGFIAKLYLFLAALQGRNAMLLALGIAMVVNSAISAYYYLNVVKQMYFADAPDTTPVSTNRTVGSVVLIAVAGTLLLFLVAQPFVSLAQGSAQASLLRYPMW